MSEERTQASETERLRAVLRAVQRLATTPEAPQNTARALIDWGMDERDAEALGAFPRERLAVYGGLVGRTVLGAVQNQLPATVARIGGEQLRPLVQSYLEEEPPRSPYLRDVPFEFAIWAATRWQAIDAPPFLADIARFELLTFAVASVERRARPDTPAPLAANQGVWLEGTVHLARFSHAVHLLFDGTGRIDAPEPKETMLVLDRDAGDDVRWMELARPAFEVLTRVAGGALLGEAIAAAAQAVGRPMDAVWIDEISGVLAVLAERGALFGAAPDAQTACLSGESSPFRGWLASG
ncbi:MAG: putative DNA-binding domain-containing protein [Polyangiaceae bacterium]